jgi:hypothetical protein
MPAKSKAQQRFMGMVRVAQKGEKPASKAVAKAAKQIDPEDVEDYASTKHKGKPEKVKKEAVKINVDTLLANPKIQKLLKKWGVKKGQDNVVKLLNYFANNPTHLRKFGFAENVEEAKERDYKAEYKKFQSSTKSKKYRAELNAYNRKKGTYGNGDGKDASHKNGKIAGFEEQSKNRGRREKSRLKKEQKLTKSKLKEMVEDVLNEASGGGKEKVYMLNGMLWLSYSPDSGQTTRVRGRGWITDKSGHKNFDSGVKGFAKWSKTQKPISKKTASNGSKVSLFKIPEFSGGSAKEYTI